MSPDVFGCLKRRVSNFFGTIKVGFGNDPKNVLEQNVEENQISSSVSLHSMTLRGNIVNS